MNLLIRRHLKLLEAVALVLTLGAWALNWAAVRRWDDAEVRVSMALDAIQGGTAVAQVIDMVRLEAAVTRAWVSTPPGSVEAHHDYEHSWDSARVRSNWMDARRSNYRSIDGALELLSDVVDVYDLELSSGLERAVVAADSLRRAYSPLLADIGAKSPTPVPEADSLTFSHAWQLSSDLIDLDAQVTAVAGELVSRIRGKRTSSSRGYVVVFVIGAGLLIASRVGEWLWGDNVRAT